MKLLFTLIFSLLLLQLQAQKNNGTTILFEFDKSIVSDTSKQLINNFVKNNLLKSPYKIELRGHCDSSGPSNYNYLLSNKRVDSVYSFLLSEGIADSNIIIRKGYGEKKPLNLNATKEQRRLNRRVEIVIPSDNKLSGTSVTIDQVLSGTKLKSGDVITLKNLNFVSNTHTLIDESLPVLKKLLKIMKSNPSMVIKTEGHICCSAPDELDFIDTQTGIRDLSVARAKAVKDFLIKNKIKAKRVSYEGFGPSRPIFPFPENSEEERQANRRVEVIIVSM